MRSHPRSPAPHRSRVLATLAALLMVLALPWAAADPAAAVDQAPADAVDQAPADDGWSGNDANPYGGTDYFVDATDGDDAAAGTSPEQAWQNLTRVSEVTFAPGDRVLLQAGETWHGQQLWPKGSGEEGRPIVIDAYGDEDAAKPYVAVDGQVPSPFTTGTTKNPQTVGLTGAVVLRNQQHWEIHDLQISNDDDFSTDITRGNVVRDGISITINADLFADGEDKIMDHFRISGVDVHHVDGPSTWQQIHYGGVVFQVFGADRYASYEESAYYFSDVRIEDNTFRDVELHAIQFAFNWFFDRDAASGQYDETGKFHEGWEQLWVRERDLYSRDVYIGHNYAENIGQGAIQLANTKDMVVEYNEVNGYLQRYEGVSCALYLWAGADSVMRYNEVYGGPYDEYDGTPWDLEYTNFNVTYEYNYSHDNAAGWMAYMGNSSNSVARYNLSVNDNGVLVKNMLSTNYSPTYFTNNVFVYDGAAMDHVHDETFLDTVYFLNNVFYNTSDTPTPWSRHEDAFRLARFSHNAFYESGGVPAPDQPEDDAAVTADPQFVGDPAAYDRDGGVEDVVDSAAPFALRPTSPLVDAGRYNPNVGDADFFGTHLYYGDGIDIGLHELPVGEQVENPVDEDPIEDEDGEDRPNLALGATATASSTHPHNNFALSADKLVDGDPTTRWAAADDASWPISIDLDLGAETVFDEVQLDEYTDSGTDPRVQSFELQRRDAATGDWVTFAEGTDGIGHDHVVSGFGTVRSSALRVLLTGLVAGQQYSPTLTEIEVYGPEAAPTDPQVFPGAATFDLDPDRADDDANQVAFTVDPDGDEVTGLRYIGPEGNVLGSLDAGDYTVEEDRYVIARSFLTSRTPGDSGLRFEFGSGAHRDVSLAVVDSRPLAAAVEQARRYAPTTTGTYRPVGDALERAEQVLAALDGAGAVSHADLVAATEELQQAVAAYTGAVGPLLEPVAGPVLRGRAAVGSVLTVVPARWREHGVEVQHQWLRDGEPVAAATGRQHRVTEDDAGTVLSVRVVAEADGFAPTVVVTDGRRVG
ncbi:discoidin domain-containing protein [Auraticoccus cholistanensis]|nr:discoidin domain-containing protein [Auraticoccus cholistanensis]